MRLTEVIGRYNDAWNARLAEARINLFRKRGTHLMRIGVVSVIAVICAVAAAAFVRQGSNPPWFPSLMAFEHYDSARTHLFEQAHFPHP
jgi:hypothetical protein